MARATAARPFFKLAADATEANVQWPVPTHKGSEAHHLLGIWNTQDPTAIPMNALADAKNVNFRGEIINKRLGIAKALTSALSSPVRSFAYAQDNTAAHTWLIAFADKTAYALTGTIGSMTATDKTAGFTVDAAVQSFSYLDKLFCVNGTDALSGFDLAAGTWSNPTKNSASDNDYDAAKLSKFITGTHDRIVLAGASANPQTVYISAIGDAGYYPTGNEVTVDTNDGQQITALVNFDDWVLIFKERSMHSLPPILPQAATYQRYLISPNYGCPSGNSAAVWEQGFVLFQAQDGHVYALVRNSLNKEFMAPTKLTTNLYGTVSGFSASDIASSWAVIHDGYYKLHCGSTTLILDLLQSDLKKGADACVWAIYKYENKDQPVLFVKPDDLTLWGGGATGDGQVWAHDYSGQYYDGDTSHYVDWYAYGGIWDLGRQELYKLFDRAWVFCKGQTGVYSFSFGLAYDFNSAPNYQDVSETAGGFVLGTSVFGDTLGILAQVMQKQVVTSAQAKRVQFRAKRSDGTGAESFTGFVVYYVPLSAI